MLPKLDISRAEPAYVPLALPHGLNLNHQALAARHRILFYSLCQLSRPRPYLLQFAIFFLDRQEQREGVWDPGRPYR